MLGTSLSHKKPVPILNPLNNKMSFLRTSLIPGLINIANFNIKNGIKNFRIFEIGKIHEKNNNSGLFGILERESISL